MFDFLQYLTLPESTLLGAVVAGFFGFLGILVNNRIQRNKSNIDIEEAKQAAFKMIQDINNELRMDNSVAKSDAKFAREEVVRIRLKLEVLEEERNNLKLKLASLQEQLTATLKEKDGLQDRIKILDVEINVLKKAILDKG